ncbi:hypothetical protein NFC73_11570 [Pseudarthrobacter sp. RMG13]|uniref:ATP-binding protein n=1 Tax=Pseudarthrobacter humi TaxID=2952523 RepID=A0ABT1LRE0_9MICC|nr:hypothetical protein [Pseudarthrobacter humi]MCP9000361.1 hypothetical protein [Pseudarthrobacter humi]
MTGAKQDVLRELSFGQRVAEDEVDQLADYFVQTEQWRQLVRGQVDVVFGPKGAGKSAMYSTLLQLSDAMYEDGIVLISAEKPRGTPAFRTLSEDAPASEIEFVSLWKMYILSLIGSMFDDMNIAGQRAEEVKAALVGEGLLPTSKASLGARLKMVLAWVRRRLAPESVEGGVELDPFTGMPSGLNGKITLREPSVAEDAGGAVSVDSLLADANEVMVLNNLSAWVVFDRLDVAFSDSHDLEANALRALFKCYLDLLSYSNISLKIFLRNDIWTKIVDGGFREASHITRHLTINWSQASLLNLVVKRILNRQAVVAYAAVDASAVLLSASLQRKLFDSFYPEKIDVGRNNPATFEWILGRVQDGTKTVAPREVIHILTEAKSNQLAMLERGEDEPQGSELFTRQAVRDALPTVSRVRLEQTIYAEYPEVKAWLEALDSEKSDQFPSSLAQIWGVNEDEATQRARRLVEVGVFELRGDKKAPRYWVPFLYRPGLAVVQGKAI